MTNIHLSWASRLLSRSLRWGLRGLWATGAAGVTAEGLEHIPRRGRVIIAANHNSQIDPALLWSVLPRPPVFMAMAELQQRRVVAAIMRATGQIYVDRQDLLSRDNPHSGYNAARAAVTHLRREGLLVIFPEDGISPAGQMLPLHAGVARMALETDTVIVPVGIVGSHRIWPPDGRFTMGRGAHIRFGHPISAGGFPNTSGNRLAMMANLEAALSQLSGQRPAAGREEV